MRQTLTLIAGAGIGAVLALTVAAGGPYDKQTAQEVIAITKAEWAAGMAKNTSAALKNVANDCTMFTPDFPSRINGKEAIYNLTEAEAAGTGSLILAEMSNEHVQTYGNVAVLSYNFMGMSRDKAGNTEPIAAKSSRVYVKENGQWWLVHANFAPAG